MELAFPLAVQVSMLDLGSAHSQHQRAGLGDRPFDASQLLPDLQTDRDPMSEPGQCLGQRRGAVPAEPRPNCQHRMVFVLSH